MMLSVAPLVETVATKPRRPKPVVAVAPEGAPAVVVDDLVTIDLAALVFGLTRKAIEAKMARGQWLEGRQYHRDPQGGIWISRKGVRAWVVGGQA